MFQSFDAKTTPDQGPPRVAALRAQMQAEGIDAFLVPRADRFQGEYVAPCDERLAWLTGFTGSAGFAAILADKAGIFVDGRYRVQVRAQSDMGTFSPVDWPETKLEDWLKDQFPGGGVVAYDPWLHSAAEVTRLSKALAPRQITLRAVENLVDRIWDDRPAPPMAPASTWPETYAGLSATAKLDAVAGDLAEAGEDAALITQPDSICWLLNLRGGDVGHTPLVHAMGVLRRTGALELFVESEKLAGVTLPPAVTVHAPETLPEAMAALEGKVRVDQNSAPQALVDALEDGPAKVVAGSDPCLIRKARKHPAEIAATTEAHLRDGAAFARFLRWFDETAPWGRLTEIDVARALEGFRAETGALKDISFDTIAGAGPHGAIVHYRVTEETNRPVRPGELLLVDSGGQYLDGTTDITRTIAIGMPTGEQRACFTRVLQGMIAISRARWPRGLTGRDLDPLARAPLWMAGQDFDHGTGHGVGVYLSVHEGPQGLSRRSKVPLEPGMILSNEPGYYREGAFGIRIENLLVVEEAPSLDGGDDRDQLALRTLTFAPIDRRLIDETVLAPAERAWLNSYHEEVDRLISPRVTDSTRRWLAGATRPV